LSAPGTQGLSSVVVMWNAGEVTVMFCGMSLLWLQVGLKKILSVLG